MAHFTRGLATYAAILLFCIARSPASGEQPDLAEIIRRHSDWRESFVNVRLKWELRSRKTPADEAGPSAEAAVRMEDVAPFHVEEWLWANHGLTYQEGNTFYNIAGSGSRTVGLWNARENISYRARYSRSPEKGEILESLELAGSIGEPPVSALGPLSLNAWLDDLLSDPESGWRMEGLEQVGPHACVRLASPPTHAVLWLDVEHDYLPRRYLNRHVHLAPDNPEKSLAWDFRVEEFQRLETGIWFPKRGVNLNIRNPDEPPETTDWIITQVEVNSDLPAARFAVPAPDIGTHVTDMFSGQNYRVASEADRQKIKASIDERAKLDDPNSTTEAASGWTLWGLSRSTWLLVIAVVMLLVANWVLRRKKVSVS